MDAGADFSPLRLPDDPGPSPSAAEIDRDPCLLCGQDPTWFCQHCKHVFCSACWEGVAVHRESPRARSKLPHERVDLKVYYRLSEIFDQNNNPASQRAALSEWEAGAKWFYVSRAGDGDFRLGSTRRFRELTPHRWEKKCPEQFPSLVSFIGQTGKNSS